MARYFDVSSSQYLSYAGAVRSSFPMTVAFWFYCETATANRQIFSQGVNAANRMYLFINQTSAALRAQLITSGGDDSDLSIACGTGTTYHHATWTLDTNDIALYFDGGGKTTDATAAAPGAAYTATRIGAAYNNAAPFDGAIGEGGAWSAKLADEEAAALAAGASPLTIRPQNLIAYWPLWRDEDQDYVGGYNMTPVNSPTVATHIPSIFGRAMPLQAFTAAAAAGVTIPPLYMHYARLRAA